MIKMRCYEFCTLMPKLVETYLAHCEFFYLYDFMTILMDLLVELLDDKYGWLEYFIFEKKCNWFEYEEDGEVCQVDSYIKLYNLIVGS